MNPKLREMYDQERALQAEALALINDPNASIDDINAKQKDLETLQAKISLMKNAEDAEPEDEPQGRRVDNALEGSEAPEYNARMLYNAITGKLTAEEKQVASKYYNQLTSKEDKDGGYTIPADLTEEIIKSIKQEESLRNLVRVESVTSNRGQRIVRTGEPNKLFNTGEREEIKKMNNPQYDVIPYAIHKYAGLMDVPSELLDDSFVNFISEIRQWLSDAARETENEHLLYGDGDKNPTGLLTEDKYYTELKAPATISIKALRKIKNTLKQGYRVNAKWVMNTEAFELLSNIEDKNGRGILAEDPRKEDGYTLFGRPVVIYDTIRTEGSKTVIMFGDFNRGYRMFDRKHFEIRMTDVGAGAFETDTTKARGIERFDGQRMDKEAIIIVRGVTVGEDVPPSEPDGE